MRVFGIDPGTRFLGFGVVEQNEGRLWHVGHGVLKADPKSSLESRLCALHAGLAVALAQYRPDAVAVEGLFTFKNARSALILGHARGVALLVAAQQGLSIHEYAPARVKKSVGASGSGAKEAVSRMVRALLRLPELERHDASDALAVAICHLNQLGPRPAAKASHTPRVALAAFADRLRSATRRVGPESPLSR